MRRCVFDLADQHHVVARGHHLMVRTFEHRNGALNDGRPRQALPPSGALEAVNAFAGKTFGQRRWSAASIDGVMGGTPQSPARPMSWTTGTTTPAVAPTTPTRTSWP